MASYWPPPEELEAQRRRLAAWRPWAMAIAAVLATALGAIVAMNLGIGPLLFGRG